MEQLKKFLRKQRKNYRRLSSTSRDGNWHSLASLGKTFFSPILKFTLVITIYTFLSKLEPITWFNFQFFSFAFHVSNKTGSLGEYEEIFERLMFSKTFTSAIQTPGWGTSRNSWWGCAARFSKS